MFFWAKRTGMKLHCIQPGKPTQNAFVESFNGKFREYYLDLHWFTSLDDARSIIKQWRSHYNHVRLHRSLGKLPPVVFAREVAWLNLPYQTWLGLRGTVTGSIVTMCPIFS